MMKKRDKNNKKVRSYAVKKKLFRSNMLFLFLSMVTLLLIGTAVIGACEDRFERTFEEIGYEKDGRGCMGYLEGYRERSHPGVFFISGTDRAGCRHYSDSGIASPGIHIYKRMNRLVMEPLDCLVEGAKGSRTAIWKKRSYMKDRKSSNRSAVRSMRCRGQFWKIRRYGNGMKRQGQIW